MVIDAAKAIIANSVKKSMAYCTIIMLFSSVMQYTKIVVLANRFKQVQKHITNFQNCKCEFDKKKYKLKDGIWKKRHLNKFSEYFRKQWINSRFKNCKLYSTPLG